MNVLVLLPDFLRVLALIPFGSPLKPLIDEILTITANLIEQGETGAAAFQQFTQDVKTMVAAGREPTPEEWNALKARSDAASTDIQSAAKPVPSP